jgi:transposase
MEILLSDHEIQTWIIPHLTTGTRGFGTKFELTNLVRVILYRLKSGCQWRSLPLKAFFGDTPISWQNVYHHFNQWSKDGCWVTIWQHFLVEHRAELDMSSIALDGSHTPAKRGGEAVAYQGRKSAKTTNALFLVDKQGVPLAMGEPQAGNHHDVYDIKTIFQTMLDTLKAAEIKVEGLFLNADPGFDATVVKEICDNEDIIANIKPVKRDNKKADTEPHQDGALVFDELLYKERSVVEHTNAWIDAYKILLVRFETSLRNWKSLHYIAFLLIFNRKIKNRQNKKNSSN